MDALPKRDVESVQQSWALINADLQAVGKAILLKLFEKYPGYQDLFPAFKGVPKDSLNENAGFCKHALNLVNAFNTAIQIANDPKKLSSTLQSVGEMHVKRNVTSQHFSNTEEVILEVLTEALGEKSTPELLDSWKKCVHVFSSGIAEGAK